MVLKKGEPHRHIEKIVFWYGNWLPLRTPTLNILVYWIMARIAFQVSKAMFLPGFKKGEPHRHIERIAFDV